MARAEPKPALWRIQVGNSRQPVAEYAVFAHTLKARLRGLLGCDALPAGHALIFPQCGSIHTLGMRFSIDVIFVDRQWRVLAWRTQVPPWRVLVGPLWNTWAVVETAAGALGRLSMQAGDQLELVQHAGTG